jgi:4-hydroxy-3-polyprenylbenzoate decarboxylase
MQATKIVIYVEHTVDPHDLTVAMWRFCNNLDPRRDNILYQDQANRSFACVGFDGTRKTNSLDGFQRDWPNIIVADDETIEAVDALWPKLGIGELIPSPSLKFRDQLYGLEAVAT